MSSAADLAFSISNLQCEGKSLIFEAIGITKDFVPQHLLQHFAETAVNKEIRFRHISPDKVIESYLGRVISTEVQDGKMKIKGEIEGFTAEQLATQQWIREQQAKNDPLGISMGIVLFHNNSTKKLENVEAREASITPKPQCGECRIIKLLNEKQNGEMRVMTAGEQPTPQQAPSATQPAQPQVDPKIAELEKNFALLTKENAALKEYIGNINATHDKALKELEQARTLPIRNEIASLQKLEGPDFTAEVQRLEARPADILGEIREKLLRSRGGQPAPRNQAIPASTLLQPQQLDVANMTRDEKVKFAEDFYKKHTKRSVS